MTGTGTSLCTAVALAFLGAMSAADEKTGKPNTDTLVITLSLSEQSYNPLKPSKAVIKCVVRNGSDKPIGVPTGYDSANIQLHSGLLSLRGISPPAQPGAPKDKNFAPLAPGKDRVVFEFPLDDILLRDAKAKPAFHWDWPRRPAPPLSPIHKVRESGFKDQASFQVDLRTSTGDVARSNQVVLKVDPVEK